MFQNRYATLIGQSGREDVMKGQLGTLKSLLGKSFKKFLRECKCGVTRSRNQQCTDLQDYETSNYVSFRDNEIFDLEDEHFPKLSTFFEQYLKDLLDEIDVYFPGQEEKKKAKLNMKAFRAFDQTKWPTSSLHIPNYTPKSIKEVAKIFSINYDNSLQTEFNELVTTILKNSIEIESQGMIGNEDLSIANQDFWCQHKKDDHLMFWIYLLEKFSPKMSNDLILLIRKILILPMGSGK